MKTTPFTEKHIALGAKMHEFAGYNMPIKNTSLCVRVLESLMFRIWENFG